MTIYKKIAIVSGLGSALFLSACMKQKQKSDQPTQTPQSQQEPMMQSSAPVAGPASGVQLHPNLPDVSGLVQYQVEGVKYWILREGSGESPKYGDLLKVHYHGWLSNGSTFDSSYEAGTPFQFTLGGRVIKGWNLLTSRLKRGDIVLAEIPPELGYGNLDMDIIPANSTLYFKIEMLDFYSGR